jgi:hypothetical protein
MKTGLAGGRREVGAGIALKMHDAEIRSHDQGGWRIVLEQRRFRCPAEIDTGTGRCDAARRGFRLSRLVRDGGERAKTGRQGRAAEQPVLLVVRRKYIGVIADRFRVPEEEKAARFESVLKHRQRSFLKGRGHVNENVPAADEIQLGKGGSCARSCRAKTHKSRTDFRI